MSDICTILKLILVIPVMNTISERSASALHRVKKVFKIDNDTQTF